MIRVGINGCNGSMGHVLESFIKEYNGIETVVGICKAGKSTKEDYPVYDCVLDIKEDIDVIIDFSHPDSLEVLLDYCIANKLPLVIATTGYSPKQRATMRLASEEIPILYSGNMSLGINILIRAVKDMAKVLWEDFDIEIIEKHHNRKLDAPSGTAYMIADGINQVLDNSKELVFGREGRRSKRDRSEIGIHAIRGGTIVGEHSVIFAGIDEIIEIKHTAMSKQIFAMGAINGARFIINQDKGLYTMDDMFSWIQKANNK